MLKAYSENPRYWILLSAQDTFGKDLGTTFMLSLQGLLASPTVCNPTKNSLGTNRVGLTKSDCIKNKN